MVGSSRVKAGSLLVRVAAAAQIGARVAPEPGWDFRLGHDSGCILSQGENFIFARG